MAKHKFTIEIELEDDKRCDGCPCVGDVDGFMVCNLFSQGIDYYHTNEYIGNRLQECIDKFGLAPKKFGKYKSSIGLYNAVADALNGI